MAKLGDSGYPKSERTYRGALDILEKCLEPRLSNIRHIKRALLLTPTLVTAGFCINGLTPQTLEGFTGFISYFIFITRSKIMEESQLHKTVHY